MPPQPRLAVTDGPTERAVPPRVPPQNTEPPPQAAPPGTVLPGPTARKRWNRAARASGFPLAVYGATLLLHLAMLAVMNPPGGPGVRDRLLSWDGQWFVAIARAGYSHDSAFTADGLSGGDLAFFPAYPFLVRAVHAMTGLDHRSAALVVSHLALTVALLCVHRLLLDLYGRRTARIALVLLACAQPMALVFLMAYSESLFLALASAALLAVHRRAWLTAGVLVLLAGLTRPVAVALVAALAVAVVLRLRGTGRMSWRPPAALVLASCGTPAYLVWVDRRTGRPGTWFAIQEAGWGTRWDNGATFVDFLVKTLTRGDGWVPVSTALLVLALLAGTMAAWCDEIWPPLAVYGTVIVITALGQSNFYHSKLRLLTIALVFLIPAARALARARTGTAVATLTAAALFGSWYGAYMLTTWRYAI
ncbi:hypothetical protein [Streptomyces sp. NPDC046862]|uniref:hypothetical protein n=1 Tax=Streptomyces sp. NPDC046862 TaxID=3154603 RepID=UPI0034525E66